MPPARFDLPLRIVVDDPVPGLRLALQRGAGPAAELVGAATGSGEPLAFDLEVTVDGALADGRPRLLGAYAQGTPTERFVYLCVGRMADQPDSAWSGRVKVPLGELSWELIEALPAGQRLEAHIAGRGRREGPALATVRLMPPGWGAA